MILQHRFTLLHIFWIRVFCEKKITIRQVPYNSIRMAIYAFFIIPGNEVYFATEQASQFCKKFASRIVWIGLNYFVHHDNSIIAFDNVSAINNYVCIYHLCFITYNSASNISSIFCQ